MTPEAFEDIKKALERIEEERDAIRLGDNLSPQYDNWLIGRTVVADCTPGKCSHLQYPKNFYNFSKSGRGKWVKLINFYINFRKCTISNWIFDGYGIRGTN